MPETASKPPLLPDPWPLQARKREAALAAALAQSRAQVIALLEAIRAHGMV